MVAAAERPVGTTSAEISVASGSGWSRRSMLEMSMNSDRIAGAAEQAKGKVEMAAGTSSRRRRRTRRQRPGTASSRCADPTPRIVWQLAVGRLLAAGRKRHLGPIHLHAVGGG